jgi:hypothetical protein
MQVLKYGIGKEVKEKKPSVVLVPWRRMGSGCIDPHFLDLGTSWRWVAKFTPRQLHTQGIEPPVRIWYEIGWTSEPVWAIWRGENPWPYRDSNSDPSVVQPVASRYTEYAIPDPRRNMHVCQKYRRVGETEGELWRLHCRGGGGTKCLAR